jgi:hypothetical protein
MRATLILPLALILSGPPAFADPPLTAPPAAATAPQVSPANTAGNRTTVEGLTVTGRLLGGKRCRETDKACLLVVAREIWDKYPHEIALYCQKERMRAFSDRMNKEAMFGTGDTPGVDTNISSRLPPALEIVCSYKPTPLNEPAN